MKKCIFLSVMLFVLAFTINAQNDTMYIMKAGAIVGQFNVNTQVDSIIFYKPLTNPNIGSFTDSRDGNIYNWVKIGEQVWMAENLKYLPSVVGPATGSLTTPYYYVYDYNGTNVIEAKATDNYATYGVLYNWAAAMDGTASSSTNPSGVQGVCPAGWHLPSDDEWTQLTDFLGGAAIAGGKLKEAGFAHWSIPNTGATNETGFTALPGGFRYSNGTFSSINGSGYWWCATESGTNYAWERGMASNGSNVDRRNNGKDFGFSVRCIRD